MEITFNFFSEMKVLKVEGTIDMNYLANFKNAVSDLTNGENKNVIIDLKRVPFLDSSGINVCTA